MPPKLWKYYLQAALYPLIFSLLATTGWLLYDHRWGSLSNFTHEQLGGDQLDLTLILLSLGNGLVLAALTTPLYFNASAKIRNNPLVSLLSWSLLPMLWLLYIGTYVDADDLETIALLLTVTLPYLIAHPWTFSRYRRELSDSRAAAPTHPSPSLPATPGAPEH
ncbi:MAG TPA: hypothetical protein VHE34_05160 [Puia sp.]|uniref:hypothetical protein n=1 Tax=Puia sp. TaxID=2045100 RepID=UPI002BD1B1EF|nr:hypothetical protein [Puia sp.]HVU94589.1 hypothetical protein [Puia sp.]